MIEFSYFEKQSLISFIFYNFNLKILSCSKFIILSKALFTTKFVELLLEINNYLIRYL
jgi:hypothetical protein